MKIKQLQLKDFRGYEQASFEFKDFCCLVGPNGIGKTTVLEAISLLCSSLDFGDDDLGDDVQEWAPRVTGQMRREAFLKKNIRSYGGGDDPSGFEVKGTFEHEGEKLVVILNEKGFQRNDLLDQSWWWQRIAYFARFDSDMTRFQLRMGLWPRFSRHFEGITGYAVEPEVMTESDLEDIGLDGRIVTGFWMDKGRRGRIHSRRASAGEKKISKALAEIVNIEKSPHIALVDNLTMHVHYKRHERMYDELCSLFEGIQVISTTHSTVLAGNDGQVIDVEKVLEESNES